MAPKFGTSGLRGLVAELTDALVAAHVAAFARCCDTGGQLFIGQDLRASSPRIAAAAAAAAAGAGLSVTDCGRLPTPALALAAAAAGAGAVMVTGSHIPDDRNGLKFYTRGGEITKADEAAIAAALEGGGTGAAAAAPAGMRTGGDAALGAYRERYLGAFGPGALAGMTVGLYEHSTVARDLLAQMLAALGARLHRFGRSGRFVPVDTEAVPAETRAMLRAEAAAVPLDAIVSADGDADRPLLADAAGDVLPGDLAGLVTARLAGADTVVTPVSSSTAIERSGAFARVLRTRIGSPHVIAGIAAARAADPGAKVAGFEANGGFLLGFAARLPGGVLAPLATRDAALPILAVLAAARAAGGLAALVAGLPARATAADRLQGVAPERSAALLAALTADAAARARVFGAAETGRNLTDGLRLEFADGSIVHLRPSGNAPELRCYAEAGDAATASRLVAETLARLAPRLR